ncbi:MAG: hypothetical protein A2Y62_00285 [Candidatus Fischerbacteria bacterium RBG_13_37_8]|uniref:DUF465 domain-containing protein n=1 Tax=Candidatus Fischerbacteria bacterium RBG_13_37_8 TaxID=1817863 RepID=A0A1F5VRJ2_9BACT|nr:MAG: hypothetical protein A2Y62_00285 [Candidatus Fischerbacteria bacterium RBG_13_37_8]
MDEETVKKKLMAEDQEFNELIHEHQQCEEKLKFFDEKKYLTEEERIREVEIKKMKLGIKDKIYQRIRVYQQNLENQNH